MKRLVTIWVVAILVMVGSWLYISRSIASAADVDKLDGECTGQETAGRCADKPAGCPYDVSIPIDSPKCVAQPAPQVQAAETSLKPFVGK